MKRLCKQGFSMIELLVVLLIIGILAAVAAPLFLANTSKAQISEAVAGAGEIRGGERSYDTQNNVFLAVASSEVGNFGTNGTNNSLLGVTIHGNKYFSPAAYTVDISGAAVNGWPNGVAGVSATPVDFEITVKGSATAPLTAGDQDGASAVTNAATAAGNPVLNFEVEMDNAGQIIYTTNLNAATPVWSKY